MQKDLTLQSHEIKYYSTDLPEELLLKIVTYLSFRDWARVGRVNRNFRAIVQDTALWNKYLSGNMDNAVPSYWIRAKNQYDSPNINGQFFNVLAAVREKGELLKDASEAFKSSLDIVLAAVETNGCALQYVPE